MSCSEDSEPTIYSFLKRLRLLLLRSTLHLDRTEEEALKHFRNDFNESLRSAWTISLDWWFHMMNQLRYKGVKG